MRQASHFLKSYRSLTGFSQQDVAHLIGASSHWGVSRHERHSRGVTLRTALAYEVIYGRSVANIFQLTHVGIRSAIVRRAKALLDDFPSTGNPIRDARRKESLQAIVLCA